MRKSHTMLAAVGVRLLGACMVGTGQAKPGAAGKAAGKAAPMAGMQVLAHSLLPHSRAGVFTYRLNLRLGLTQIRP